MSNSGYASDYPRKNYRKGNYYKSMDVKSRR